jgi:hypothetical protein
MADSSLTKQDVARRQLVTAIHLHFDGGDLVSIYSLAANAWEIIDTLASRAGVASISNQTRQNVPSGKDLKRDYINEPHRNFFKHANRDPDKLVPALSAPSVDSIVFLGVEDYLRLYRKAPVEFQVFQLWYLALNTGKVSVDAFADLMPNIDSAFPNIRQLERHQQLRLGRNVLNNALQDGELMRDSRTEGAL